MNKDKLLKLEKYLSQMQDKLNSPIPPKHANHPESYKQFLRNEISTVKTKIESAKLEGVK